MPTWVPPEQRDSRYFIWNELFKVRVSNIQSMSTHYLKHFGMPAIGEPGYDQGTANELIVTMISINAMVDYYEKGVNVYVVNPADTKIIYDHIQNHLHTWMHKLDNGLNIRDAPIKDLLMMDKFANVVYAHAKYEFTETYVDSIIARRMSSALRVNRSSVLGNYAPETVTINGVTNEEKVEEKKFPERASMAETFANARPTSQHRWRG